MTSSLEPGSQGRPNRALRDLAAIVVLMFAAPGCDIGLFTKSARLDVAFDRTGSIQSDGYYVPMSTNKTVSLGDTGGDIAERSIVSVTLGAIPPGANVTKVVLTLVKAAPFGNPYDDFGSISVDHVDVVSGIAAAQFTGNTLTAAIATIAQDTTFPTFELDVTDYVNADIAAGRPIASFRLQFSAAPSNDSSSDRVFFSADPDYPALQPFATATFLP